MLPVQLIQILAATSTLTVSPPFFELPERMTTPFNVRAKVRKIYQQVFISLNW